jgi:uncharacterized protein (TIGR02246 family)
MTMTVQETFTKGTDAFNAHDRDAFAALMAPDADVEAPGGFHGRGREACVAFFAGWFEAFPDAHVDVRALHLLEDLAVEEGVFTGTHDGVLRTPGGDVPPTGRAVAVRYCQIIRIRSGLHASFRLWFDRLEMLEQLGLLPSEAAG